MGHYYAEIYGEAFESCTHLKTQAELALAIQHLKQVDLIPQRIRNRAWHIRAFKKEWITSDPKRTWYRIDYDHHYIDKKKKQCVFHYTHTLSVEVFAQLKEKRQSRTRKKAL